MSHLQTQLQRPAKKQAAQGTCFTEEEKNDLQLEGEEIPITPNLATDPSSTNGTPGQT